jgi:hypothetical protein
LQWNETQDFTARKREGDGPAKVENSVGVGDQPGEPSDGVVSSQPGHFVYDEEQRH